MDWTIFLLRILPCLLVAGLLGTLIGWLLGRIFGSANSTELVTEWEGKLRHRDQELGSMRGDLSAANAKVNSLQSEMATLAETIKTRDKWVSELETKQKAIETDLNDRISELDELKADTDKEKADLKTKLENALAASKAETESLRVRVAEAEGAAKIAQKAERELATLRGSFTGKEQELAKALFRLKNLEPLTAQIKEHESAAAALKAQIKELEAQTLSAKSKDGEIAKLRQKVTELEPLAVQLKSRDGQLSELQAKLGGSAKALIGNDSELKSLRVRMTEIEGLSEHANNQLKDRDSELARLRLKIGELKALSGQLAERESEISELRKQVGTMAGLTQQLSEREARLAQLQASLDDSQQKYHTFEAEIGTLRQNLVGKEADLTGLFSRIALLEPLNDQVADLNDKLRKSTTGSESETGSLQKRSAELESLTGQAGERESLIAKLRLQLSELAPLTLEVQSREARIREFDNLIKSRDSELVQLNAHNQELAAKLQTLSAEKESELAPLRLQVREIAGLNKQVEESNRLAATVREKDQEIARLRARTTELEMMAREVKESKANVSAASAMPPSNNEKDDLKKIFGIGPVLEKLLNSHGIYCFQQIAEWKQEDVQHYDHLLEDFRGRIVRDDWVSGASEEQARKYGDRP